MIVEYDDGWLAEIRREDLPGAPVSNKAQDDKIARPREVRNGKQSTMNE
jgi:hypothetical protein